MFNIKANGEVILITSCSEELEEFLDEHAELAKRHGYELCVNGTPIHTLEHPIPSILAACEEGSLP